MIKDNLNIIIKCIFINLYSLIIFTIIKNCKNIGKSKYILCIILIIAESILYVYLKKVLDIIISVIVICLLQVFIFKIITKSNNTNSFTAVVISNSISYILFVISGTIEFTLQQIFDLGNVTINLIITLFLEGAIIFRIKKIKRLKNGLSFLQSKNEYIEIVVNIMAFILVLVYGLISYNNERIYKYLYFYYITLSILIVLIIQKTMVMYYKQKLIDDTINQYQKELKEKDEKIEKLTKENYRASKINHEFYNRQKSLEYMVKNSLTNYNIELGEDVDILSKIKNLTEEHSNKVSEDKILLKLETTGIDEVDEMFTYMQQECIKNNIEFKLKINGNIYPLINNYITKSQLVTLIGDHLRDAIIAINFSNKSNKKIFVILGTKENCYELCIYDSGIEFEIQTLLKLGMEPITTHKNSGGTGIGFMTTFETLKECKASLIIEEYGDNIEYTKLVKFKFDKKSEYKICSYRSDEIKKLDYSNRIKIENKLTNL